MADLLERLQQALASRYRIERELGRGGMAMVYLAEDLRHHRPVALKVLDPEVAAAIGPDRFLHEIETAASLQHPHILPLFDSGFAEGLLYYVMPYVAGESLRHRLTREKQLALDEALQITREVADALNHAHREGVIHRDIKPENILLESGHAVVADFGIARVIAAAGGEKLTATGIAVGTPEYMSPEQAAGSRDLDGRSDLYSLGCVLYEMLAGQPPFTGPTAESLAHQHLNVAPRPVTALRPAVPDGIARTIDKTLAKAPADRYASTAELAEALADARQGGPTPTPSPQRIAPTTPNNLPAERTRFIGRERVLEECGQALAETRLLTLTGIGGCGKTRLALRFAEGQLDRYPDGVWFVDLAPVQDGERVPWVVAGVLQVREQPGTPLLETLERRLAGRRTLLVLDNCEHLLSAASELVDRLLGAGPELKLLATSREGLGVEGEQTITVPSLSVPPPGAAEVAHVQSAESAQLFVDRARRVARDFALTQATAPGVAEICRRLDGIPLAIELAAARVKVLTVEQIRARLDDRFRLLAGGSRALPRHQTLRAVIQWSYDHLAAEEQRLFRRLSVFAGGWTLAGAVAVAGESADELAVLDTITRLVEKSLVAVGRGVEEEARYSMLETVRQYAQERLIECGEGDDARMRHLRFYLALAEEAEPKILGPGVGTWLSRLDFERENLLSAHAWCDHAEGGVERGLRLVAALVRYWSYRGLFEQGHRVTAEALRRPGAERRTLLRCRALHAAGGGLGFNMGRHVEATGHVEESLSIAREIGSTLDVARALITLATWADSVAARERHEEALTLTRQLGDKHLLCRALIALGESHRQAGELDVAEPLYEEALALCRETGDMVIGPAQLLNLAAVSVAWGRADRARALLLEAFPIVEQVGSRWTGQYALDVCGGLAAALAEWKCAACFFGASEAQKEHMGYRRQPADEAFVAPLIAKAREALGEAAFAAAEAEGRALGYEQAMAEARVWLKSGAWPSSASG